MAQAAGMRVHDAEDGKPPIGLANDPATQNLSRATKLHMTHACIAFGSSGQGAQHNAFLRFADAQKDPTRLFLPARPCLVISVLLKQRSRHTVGYQHALERRIARRPRQRAERSFEGRHVPPEKRLLEITDKPAG